MKLTIVQTRMFGSPFISEFSQEGPRLGNQFLEDLALQRFLIHFLDEEQFETVKSDLTKFGDKISREYLEMAKLAELHPPKLARYDAWGNQINKLYLSEGWKYFHKQSALEGLISIPYEQNLEQNSRIWQASKLMMFAASSGLYSCPLAMTDGAAHVLRNIIGRGSIKSGEVKECFEKLTSRNPEHFITSGQWMTEKRGGSDVRAATETVAFASSTDSGYFSLHGYKWFTSATDSSMTLALAKIVKDNGQNTNVSHENIRSIPPSLFLIKTKKQNELGETVLNDIEIVRMKDKAGTKQLPTAELLLKGTKSVLLSNPGDGIKQIVGMLHITRYHNAISAVACMRRIVHLGVDYAYRRTAFGEKLSQKPLHLVTISKLELDTRGNLLLVLEMSRILGKIDAENVTESELNVFRLTSSLLKLFTGKEVTRVTSEGIELFGGLGMMENSFIPQILRDAQVLPIWEGTTNLLSLDFLKAIMKHDNEWMSLKQYLMELSRSSTTLSAAVAHLSEDVESLKEEAKKNGLKIVEAKARSLAFNVSRVLIAALALQLPRTARNEKMRNQDELLRKHWEQRVEKENERLNKKFNVPELKDLFSADMGSYKDSRGILRARY